MWGGECLAPFGDGPDVQGRSCCFLPAFALTLLLQLRLWGLSFFGLPMGPGAQQFSRILQGFSTRWALLRKLVSWTEQLPSCLTLQCVKRHARLSSVSCKPMQIGFLLIHIHSIDFPCKEPYPVLLETCIIKFCITISVGPFSTTT